MSRITLVDIGYLNAGREPITPKAISEVQLRRTVFRILEQNVLCSIATVTSGKRARIRPSPKILLRPRPDPSMAVEPWMSLVSNVHHDAPVPFVPVPPLVEVEAHLEERVAEVAELLSLLGEEAAPGDAGHDRQPPGTRRQVRAIQD